MVMMVRSVLTSPPTCVLVGVPDLIEAHFPPFYGVGGGDNTTTSATLRKYVLMRQLEQAGKIVDVVGDGNCLFRCICTITRPDTPKCDNLWRNGTLNIEKCGRMMGHFLILVGLADCVES